MTCHLTSGSGSALSTPKPNRTKRNLDFSGKEEEFPTQGKNALNLPYSDSKEEEGLEVDLTKQVAA